MDAMKPASFDRINDINISNEMKNSFLSYAMSVIVSRALPDVRDGLKPVHRRILYGMDELGITPEKAYKKSARIVGDVMGKYHPHGDSAIYDAMVRMAQPFSYRHTLVDGHGNFGSIDGDGAAAMRYTEAKMEKISVEMLRDIRKGTVAFEENYDGTEKEPVVLPSGFPNLLVNGSTGIAVGMATNIPPHNLGEVIDGVLAYMDDADIPLDDLMEYIKGPDFPTGGLVMGLSGLRQAYATGTGSIKVRARSEITTLENGKHVITVTEIPYQVNKTRLIEKIADLAKEKRIEGVTDLRDESNRDGIKIIIELRRDVNAEVVLNNLYRHTPLQTSFGINMLALVDRKPQVLSLKDTIRHYLDHRVEILTKRVEHDLAKARARAHIVEGLLKALGNIDEVVEVIKNAYDDAEGQLMEKFSLSQEQARAILEMRLRKLSGLEREKLEGELGQLRADIAEYEQILASEEKKREVIRAELLEVKRRFASERRTEISLSLDLDLEDEDLIPEEDVIITITRDGYCKRMNAETYRRQNRGGKGMTGIRMHEEDTVEHILYTSTHEYLLFFTNTGSVYRLKGYRIPVFGRTSKGIPLVNLIEFETDERLQAVTSMGSFADESYLLFVTRGGVVKRTAVRAFQNIRSTGIRAISLREGDELLDVKRTDGTKDIVLGASNGKAIRFSENSIRPMGRVASGVRGIELAEGAAVVGAATVDEETTEVLIATEHGYGKRTVVNEYRRQNRGGKGVKTLNVTEKNGRLVALRSVCGHEDLILFSDKGTMIRMPVAQISCSSRATQGVRLMKLDAGHRIASLALVPGEETEEVEEPAPTRIEETKAPFQENPSDDEAETTPEEKPQAVQSEIETTTLLDLLDEDGTQDDD